MKLKTSKIEELIARQGATKRDVAEKAGIARNNLSTIIRRGTCEPRTAAKIAAALCVDVSEICGEV